MTFLLIALVTILGPSWAFAADYYVRPLGGSYGAENGTSYADAFDGFADMSGIAAGDTIYVCGAHSEALTTSTSGTSGNPIIVDGRCTDDDGSLNIGAGARNIILNDGVGEDYWTFRYLTISGGTGAGTALYCNGVTDCNGIVFEYNTVTCTNAAATTQAIRIRSPKAVWIHHNTLDGSSGNCGNGIILDTAAAPLTTHINNIIEYNTVHGFGGIGIRINGVNQTDVNPGPNYIRYNTTYDNGDGIYPVNADRLQINNNTSYGNNRTNYAGEGYGLASTWCDLSLWEYNLSYSNRTKGIEVYADTLRHLTGVTIRYNQFLFNPTELIAFRCTIDVNNGTIAEANAYTGVLVYANVVIGGTCGIEIAPGVVGTVANNTIVNPLLESGIYLEGDADNLTIRNNLCSINLALPCIRMSDAGVGASITVKSNFYDNSVATVLARKASTNYTVADIATLDTGAVVGNPLLVTDYKTQGNSTARRAGSAWADCKDARGRVCWSPPDIGAYQSTSGDPANARAVRQ